MKNKVLFNKPYISKIDQKYINKVFKRGKFTDGIFQKKCENFIKKKIKSKFVALTQNCSSALEIAIQLLNLKKGDEVIMPSYTFTSTANAVLLNGAKPVFADINLGDANLDPNSVKKKINKNTKAIILVHYGGNSCDMDEFIKIKKKYNLIIIEDAAHGFLGKFKNKYLGTIGDFGAFSFHETKNFVGGQCGALSVNNASFLNKVNIILDKGTDRAIIHNKKKYYSWKGVGSEYRSAELPSALLFSQLVKNQLIQSQRSKLWNFYFKSFSEIDSKEFTVFSVNNRNKSAYHVFSIIFNNFGIREKFINYMKKKGIFCYFHYFPLHMSSFGKKFQKTKMTNTEKIYNGLVRLPLYPGLKINDQKRVIIEAKKFLKFK